MSPVLVNRTGVPCPGKQPGLRLRDYKALQIFGCVDLVTLFDCSTVKDSKAVLGFN